MKPYPSSVLRRMQPSPFALRTPHSALRTGFTLIELLVVISIISLLAALIFPITGAINRNKIRAKARAELALVQTAIESYKAKMGHYPPDNPGFPATNQLYFELLGTLHTNTPGGPMYITLDRSAQIADTPNAFVDVFGPAGSPSPKVAGFVNCSKGGSEEVAKGVAFLSNLKPGQVAELAPGVRILACSVPWNGTVSVDTYPLFGHPKINPFRYNSSHPTNNPSSYDLWVDVIVDGKTNRISNWSQQPLIVSQPY